MKKVKYIGASQEQINWGSNDDPRHLLNIGSVYEVADIEVHSYQIKIKLKDYDLWFNSVCFEGVNE